MKYITLTQEKVAIVDDEDFEWLNQWKWRFSCGYACRYQYMGKKGKGNYIYKSFSMHRQIMNTPQGRDTDHINGNGLDNRKINLRVCTRRQNLQNRFNSKRKNSNLPMGVGKERDKWRARITVNGKEIHLGIYNTPKEAGTVYNRASEKYFGEFANPNKIKNWQKIFPFKRRIYVDINKKNSSGIVGVSFHKNVKRWQVRISFKKKRIYLGSFLDKLEAAKVYKEAVKKYYGKIEKLNII